MDWVHLFLILLARKLIQKKSIQHDIECCDLQTNIFRFAMHFSQTEFETFVKAKSAAELGTSAASINRTGKTNVREGVQSNYNEYKEFHEREVEAHICAAFMEMSSMSKLER